MIVKFLPYAKKILAADNTDAAIYNCGSITGSKHTIHNG